MLWTSSTNETAAIEFVDTTVQHVAFDPSGTRVGFVGDDNTVHIKSAMVSFAGKRPPKMRRRETHS